MVNPQIPQCPKCGAAIPKVNGEWSRQCSYCGAWLTMAMPAAPPPITPPVQPSVHVVVQTFPPQRVPRAQGATKVPRVVGGFLVVAGVMFAGLIALVSNREHMQWESSVAPRPISLGSVPGRLVLGHYRVLHLGSRDKPTTVHVGLFDADTGRRRWGTDSLGRYSEDNAYRSVHSVTTADRVVVTTVTGSVRALDLATGETRAGAQLTDIALSLCPMADGHTVWIEVADQNHALFDATTGTLQRSGAPAHCATQSTRSGDECTSRGAFRPQAQCTEADGFTLPGMRVHRTLAANGVQIAIGQHQPGTGYPMVAAFNASGVVWQRPLAPSPRDAKEEAPPVADLVNGVLYVAYERSDGTIRVAALDARSGSQRWESSPPDSRGSAPTTMTVTNDRVYIPHWTWLDIFDASTGEHLRTIGRW